MAVFVVRPDHDPSVVLDDNTRDAFIIRRAEFMTHERLSKDFGYGQLAWGVKDEEESLEIRRQGGVGQALIAIACAPRSDAGDKAPLLVSFQRHALREPASSYCLTSLGYQMWDFILKELVNNCDPNFRQMIRMRRLAGLSLAADSADGDERSSRIENIEL
ncbi:hypothetical protein EW146_g5402 [Bondarzewia mesenterica]|uniref:Uncharacterized protein n=1 Tax=Bondarzewia mesenterica TaxID=1095465 RepID=A0A4S4LRL4_9AGAM|nr:hypothetical protein EW146_g5402 [Bondarzewia mesenterica]